MILLRAFEDLTNRKFGLLTVCQYMGEEKDKNDHVPQQGMAYVFVTESENAIEYIGEAILI